MNQCEEQKNAEIIKKYCLSIIEESGFIYLNILEVKENDNTQKKDFAKFILKYLHKRNTKKIKITLKLVKYIHEVLTDCKSSLRVDGYCIFDTTKFSLIKIKDIGDYIKAIKDLRDEDSQMKHNCEMFFRGQRNFGWSLKPSLYRDSSWIKNENIMIEEIIRQYPDFFDDKKRIDTLTKLQHYNFPTRLLDITENPLVALFFACSDKDTSTDGRIFYFKPTPEQIKYSNSDTVSVLSAISKMDYNFGTNNFENLKEKFLWALQDDKPNFQIIEETKEINKCLYVKAHFNNNRIRNQEGAFILVGIGKDKGEMANIESKSDKCEKLLMVDRTKKEKILTELSQLGINEGIIYPEIEKEAYYISCKYKTDEH